MDEFAGSENQPGPQARARILTSLAGKLYYREMKLELRTGELLQSHGPETAAREVATLVVATAR